MERMKQPPREYEYASYQKNSGEGPFQLAVASFVQAMLEERDGLAEPHYGVGQTLGVAEDEVEQPADK